MNFGQQQTTLTATATATADFADFADEYIKEMSSASRLYIVRQSA
jgi:hypothetical protein